MYTLLPFQFARHGQDVLLVNECGDFLFLSEIDFDNLIQYKLSEDTPVFPNLKAKLFLAQGNEDIAIRKTSAKYRSRKSFLRDFTVLHMMVITLRCNQKCEYCQVSCADEDSHKYDMDIRTAQKVIDRILESPPKNIKIEFQGGEPLLNWKTLEHSVLYAKNKNTTLDKSKQKEIGFVICTNLITITKEQLLFCKEHGIEISTSLDGTEFIHDSCRKLRTGGGTYKLFLEKLELTRSIVGECGVDALMTTSSFALEHLEEVVDEYIRLGMNGIFIRSLNPYGFAAEHAQTLDYSMKDFATRYLETLRYILEINKKQFFPEHFASLLFSRILTPFSTGFVDLQSPSGAGISGAIYDFDGSVFPADEARMLARMGDNHFCLGNVHEQSFSEIFNSQKMRDLTKGACVETTPTCAYCAYQSYCGTDPIRNYLECGQEVRNMSETAFCIKHKTIFDELFTMLKVASESDMAIIWSWITRNSHLVKYHEEN